jgi:hypothetical protein
MEGEGRASFLENRQSGFIFERQAGEAVRKFSALVSHLFLLADLVPVGRYGIAFNV